MLTTRWQSVTVLIILAITQYACGSSGNTNTGTGSTSNDEWLELGGHIWTGVKVYYGDAKTYGFEILGGSESCSTLASGRGIRVKYPDGTVEWKDRSALINSGLYFVQADDPALKLEEWEEFNDC